MQHGFIKVASAIPSVTVADTDSNIQEIKRLLDQAMDKEVEIVVFPELAITGYTCGDLFSQQLLLRQALQALQWLLDNNADNPTVAIIGLPLSVHSLLYNVAVVVQRDHILGVVPKTFIPNYKEFYEQRWFASADTLTETSVVLCGQTVPISPNLLFQLADATFGIEICEDLWAPVPPSSRHTLRGAQLIFNPSATNDLIGKNAYLHSLLSQQSARCICGYIYASCGYGESTQDLVFGGNALIYENGHLLAQSRRYKLTPQLVFSEIDIDHINTERQINTTFAQATLHAHATLPPASPIRVQNTRLGFHLTRSINPHPFVPEGPELAERCQEILDIQTAGLAKRIQHTKARKAVIGISGGLDSTLALLVCVRTMDQLRRPHTDILGVTMPGFGTTDRTYNNALKLMQTLGVTIREIPIRDACIQHFKDIHHNINKHDVTYENGQARERTQILFDLANQAHGLVIGTGDLSELALGWATYNGDHMSSYGVNCSIPKTLVRHLVTSVADNTVDPLIHDTLIDIIHTPVSPELLPADAAGHIQQKTEDLVGPYELHDFFLYNIVRLGFSPTKTYMLALKAFDAILDGTSTEVTKQADGVYTARMVHHWLDIFCRRFFSQQFKRSCLPDGPKVGSVSLSPRGDWRMPSDASPDLWLAECDQVKY